MSDTITLLRSETKELHQKLDQLTIFQPIFSSNAKHKDYLKYLEILYPIYNEIENQVYVEAEEWLPNITDNRRLNSLVKDFDGEPDLQKISNSIDIISKYDALGMLYVLEGSRMGGKMMAKNLRENAQLTDDQMEFLLQEMSVSWASIIKSLNSITKKDQQEQVLEGAKKMFNCFYNHCVQF